MPEQYICTGSCHGASDKPGVCQAATCEKKGQPLVSSLSIEGRLMTLELKIDATYAAANKTRRYLLWTLIISVAVIVLPLIGLAFAIPAFMSSLGAYKLF